MAEAPRELSGAWNFRDVADTVALQPEESVAFVLSELERLGVVPVAAPAAR